MSNKIQLAFLNILHGLNDGYYAVLLLFLPFISSSLDIDLKLVGALGSAAILGSIVSALQIFIAIPSGYFANRFGGIKALLIALMIYSISFVFNAGVSNYFILILTFALAGIGFGLFHPIAFAGIARLSDKSTRGTAMANFTAVGDVGRFALSSMITFIIVAIGWQLTSGVLGLIGIGLGILGLVIQKNYFKKNNNFKIEKKQKLKFDLSVFKRNKKFLLISITGFIDHFDSASLFVFLPFLLSAKGIEAGFLGSMVGIMFIGNVFGKMFFGRLVDKFKSYKVYAFAEIVMFLLIISLVFVNNVFLIGVISLLLGTVTKGTVPVLMTMNTFSLEKDGNYEQDMSKYQLVEKIFGTLSPVIFGAVGSNFGIQAAFVVLGVTCLTTLLPLYMYTKVK